MIRQYASAGAIVVTTDLRNSRTLLLDQVRVTGERQTVAAKGRLEPDEAPLAAALREVAEETGLDDVVYAGYLGQQAYRFTDNDSTPAAKTVDWFLVAAPDTTTTTTTARREEGFTAARWVDLTTAAADASHAAFADYLARAAEVLAWRQDKPLPFSTALDRVVRDLAGQATAILADQSGAGIGVCGSAARGDYVDGWSDIDLIGWGLPAGSPHTDALAARAEQTSARHGVRVSLHIADKHGRDTRAAGPLYDMKLRAALDRIGTDIPVIAGMAPAIDTEPVDLHTSLELLRDYATRSGTGQDRVRRLLSVASSAARTIVAAGSPRASLRLPNVVRLLDHRWPGNKLGALLGDYDAFRRAGAQPTDAATDLAHRVPDSLREVTELAANSHSSR
jgi:8-oxo-dGTP pyrophosphatase MutT (NUDIX family)